MKRFLRLIYNELKVLRISVVVAALTLTFFTASLFSVLNVYFNLSTNIFDNLDKSGNALSISAKNVSIVQHISASPSGSFWGHKNGLTQNAVLVNEQNGKEFSTEQQTETDGNVQWFFYSGIAYVATDEYMQTYEPYNNYIDGMFSRKTNEICLCRHIATKLDVTVGDVVWIGTGSYVVSGIYDETLLKGLPNYFICVDNNFLFDEVNVKLATSADTFNLYNKLMARGISVQVSSLYNTYIDGISTTNVFFIGNFFCNFFGKRHDYLCDVFHDYYKPQKTYLPHDHVRSIECYHI